MYTDKNAPDDACITLNSILLCDGCGGIIYPTTSGQERSAYGPMCAEILSRQHTKISKDEYDLVAKCILDGELTILDTSTLLRLCFNSYDSYENGSMNVSLKYQIDSQKHNELLDSMRNYSKENGLKHNRDVELRYNLFDGARFIREPTGGILEAGPHFELEYKTNNFNRYELSYEKMHIVALGDRFWYEPSTYNMTTYRPVNQHKELNNKVLTSEINNMHHHLAGEIVAGVGRILSPGIDTVTISTSSAFALDMGQAARWSGTGSAVLISLFDISESATQYKEFAKWEDGFRDFEDCTYLTKTLDMNFSATTFSDPEIPAVYQMSKNEWTDSRISELNSIDGINIDDGYISKALSDHEVVSTLMIKIQNAP